MIIKSVGEILKGREIYTIAPEATVRRACEMLEAHNVGALAVLRDGALVGVLSERDVIRRAVGKNRPTDETLVADIMTPNPKITGPDTSLANAVEIMVKGGFRHLPVVKEGNVLGMLSMRDIPTEYRLMFERYEASFQEFSQLNPTHV